MSEYVRRDEGEECGGLVGGVDGLDGRAGVGGGLVVKSRCAFFGGGGCSGSTGFTPPVSSKAGSLFCTMVT